MNGELGRMIMGRKFLAAVLTAMAGIAFGAAYPEIRELLTPGSFLSLEKDALLSKTVAFLLPVAAVLPWSDSFLGEWKSGFLKSSLPRCGRRSYVESKVLTVALSGFLAWVLAGVLMLGIYFIIYFPLEQQGSISLSAVTDFVAVLIRAGLTGGVVSTLGGI
ncbi:MAG: ABC transporter permease, partial [Lachnospiraceae bacterium]|nr:ABC transporter permease [Lachnospiraceae bacterium]